MGKDIKEGPQRLGEEFGFDSKCNGKSSQGFKQTCSSRDLMVTIIIDNNSWIIEFGGGVMTTWKAWVMVNSEGQGNRCLGP